MKQDLYSIDEIRLALDQGKQLLIAGDESVLKQLPAGDWIGGSIPYFMTPKGGMRNTSHAFVHELSGVATKSTFKVYDENNLMNILSDAPSHGVSYCIFPAFSPVLQQYALLAPDIPFMFHRPILGWVAGVSLDKMGSELPKVAFGPDATLHENCAAVVHCSLTDDIDAHIDIVNIFEPGNGPAIFFDECSFKVKQCTIDGRRTNLAEYIETDQIDTKLPVVTDLCGAVINSAIASIDQGNKEVTFFGPVFPGQEYRFALPVGDYAAKFSELVPRQINPRFSCNCILNYAYGELEGKVLHNASGPMTFGEIAYLLLNQTMVYVEHRKASLIA